MRNKEPDPAFLLIQSPSIQIASESMKHYC